MPLLVVAVLALAACGTQRTPTGSTTSPTTGSTTTAPTSTAPTTTGPVELVGIGTVLSVKDGPAMLCLDGVQSSMPPTCSGPPIVGWDWAKAPGSEEQIGIRWGEYAVVGHWDGTRFTLTRPATTEDDFAGKVPPRPPSATDLTTPCPAPEGGWRVVDASKATDDAFEQTATAAEKLPGFGGLWIDQPAPSGDATSSNDPAVLILNVKVTGDPSAAEAALRRTWGGKLCVSEAKRTETELRRIMDEVMSSPGILHAGPEIIREDVEVHVLHDDGTLQKAMDTKYGAGVVRVTSALFPYEAR
jgi:hypothetical protein